MSHIAVRALSVWYGAHSAVRDVTLDLPDGQITAIIGPSGCGKTTLLKCLNRLVDLNDEVRVSGSVFVDGEDVFAPTTDLLALRRKVGFLLQRPYPLPMSIYDNVAFGPRIHRVAAEDLRLQVKTLGARGLLAGLYAPGEREAEAARPGSELDVLVGAYLRLAGLWDEVRERLRAPAAGLSIGQQQRLALARTLAVEPEVLLADEATSSLDPVSAQRIEERLRLLKSHYTVVMVTHILRQARRLADYAVFMYQGDLVEHGPAAEVLQTPKDPRTRAYVSGEIS